MSVGVEAVVFDWGGTLTPWHTVDLAEQVAWQRVRDDAASARFAEILDAAGVDTAHHGRVLARDNVLHLVDRW